MQPEPRPTALSDLANRRSTLRSLASLGVVATLSFSSTSGWINAGETARESARNSDDATKDSKDAADKPERPSGRPGAPAGSSSANLQREGTKIGGITGELREAGRRWIFVSSSGQSLQVLENLALQRVVQAIRDDPTDRFWTIDGQLTEFLNENYLVIQRMVRTPRRSTSGL